MTFNKKILQISFVFVVLCFAFGQTAQAQTVATTTQAIVVQTPNGGETYDRGDAIRYSWTQKEKSKKLEISIVNASTSQPVFTAKRYDGSGLNKKSIAKKVTAEIPAGQYKLKICDVAGTTPVCDMSDGVFTITSTIEEVPENTSARSQTIVVQTPNGGETFVQGEHIKFSWNQGQDSRTLEFYIVNELDGKVVFKRKDFNGAGLNKKTFDKEAVKNIEVGSYKLRICDLKNPGSPVCDMSDKPFSIIAKPADTDVKPRTIVVEAPNGGSYNKGDRIPFTWKQSHNSKKIEVSIVNASTSQSVLTRKNTYEGWGTNKKFIAKKDTLEIPAGQYKIQVCDNEATVPACDMSDVAFTITSTVEEVVANTNPQSQNITVITPNGGEKYNAGDSISYTWRQTKNSDELQVTIVDAQNKNVYNVKRYDGWGTNTKVIAKDATSILATGQYKLKICDKLKKGSPVCDMSDKTFTITNKSVPAPVVPPTVKIVLPEDSTVDETYGDTQKQDDKKETRTEVKTNSDAKKTVDLCTNINGMQANVPKGYTKAGAAGVAGVCKETTYGDTQEQTNKKETRTETNTDTDTKKTLDLCTNINGMQANVPKGYTKAGAAGVAGICKKIAEPKKMCYITKTVKVNGKNALSKKEVGCNSEEFKNAPKNQKSTVEVAGESVTVYEITRDLELGMVHSEVKTLQEYLNSNGYIVNDIEGEAGSQDYEADYFGQKTKDAVIRFQIDNGIIPQSGVVGPMTRQAMGI